MSFESYVLRLMAEEEPGIAGRAVLSGLALLEKAYIRGVEKKRAGDSAGAVHAGVPVISVGNITAGAPERHRASCIWPPVCRKKAPSPPF